MDTTLVAMMRPEPFDQVLLVIGLLVVLATVAAMCAARERVDAS